MTDEEKKAIEDLKEVVELYNDKCLITTEDDFKSIEILLNLIEKQSKEIEELKKEQLENQKRLRSAIDLLWDAEIEKQSNKIWENMEIRKVLQSLLRKEFPVTITKEELEKRWKV